MYFCIYRSDSHARRMYVRGAHLINPTFTELKNRWCSLALHVPRSSSRHRTAAASAPPTEERAEGLARTRRVQAAVSTIVWHPDSTQYGSFFLFFVCSINKVNLCTHTHTASQHARSNCSWADPTLQKNQFPTNSPRAVVRRASDKLMRHE